MTMAPQWPIVSFLTTAAQPGTELMALTDITDTAPMAQLRITVLTDQQGLITATPLTATPTPLTALTALSTPAAAAITKLLDRVTTTALARPLREARSRMAPPAPDSTMPAAPLRAVNTMAAALETGATTMAGRHAQPAIVAGAARTREASVASMEASM